jgi:hypothetical protein
VNLLQKAFTDIPKHKSVAKPSQHSPFEPMPCEPLHICHSKSMLSLVSQSFGGLTVAGLVARFLGINSIFCGFFDRLRELRFSAAINLSISSIVKAPLMSSLLAR